MSAEVCRVWRCRLDSAAAHTQVGGFVVTATSGCMPSRMHLQPLGLLHELRNVSRVIGS